MILPPLVEPKAEPRHPHKEARIRCTGTWVSRLSAGQTEVVG